MYKRVLEKMRNLIRMRHYVMTLHANEEMDSDSLSIYDIEHCVLTGSIIEKQKELKTAERKYLIKGYSISKSEIIVVAKISITNKLVIITVFKLKDN
jgi:hypothetical protein